MTYAIKIADTDVNSKIVYLNLSGRKAFARVYRLPPKSALNLATSFPGQSETASSQPIKKPSRGHLAY